MKTFRRSSNYSSWLGYFLTVVGSVFLLKSLGSLAANKALPFSSNPDEPQYTLILAIFVAPSVLALVGVSILILSRKRRIEVDDHHIRLINERGRIEKSMSWVGVQSFQFETFGGSENLMSGGLWKLEGETETLYLSDESPDWPLICEEIERHVTNVDNIRMICRDARIKRYPE